MKWLADRLGMDRAIAYTSGARLVSAVGGVVSMLLIAGRLTGTEQGFYYTFASILAIQTFFELGLGGIIVQFVAHECAHEDEEHRSRLAYLLRWMVKWYAVLAVGLLVVLSVVGWGFFSFFYDQATETVNWRGPWMLLALGTTVNFLIAPISSFLEGMGKVREIAFVRLLQQLSSMTLLWAGLLGGLKLWSASYIAIVGSAIFVVYVWRKFGGQLGAIWRTKVTETVSYKEEIFPYQWRIALSWVSGYFIFQLFNPVLFATEGAVVAGQMGMTLAALNAVQSFSISWITTKVPAMSGLIAQRDYVGLDELYGRSSRRAQTVVGVALVGFVATVAVLQFMGTGLGNRFLPFGPTILMAATVAMNVWVFSMATYMRCHKQEPMLVNSVVMGAACMISTVTMGRLFGVNGITISYAALSVCGMIWARAIFGQKRMEWHEK